MYTMKDVCHETGMTYETLKFYCNEGLVPNVKPVSYTHLDVYKRQVYTSSESTCLP